MAYYKDIDMELTVAQDGDVSHDEDEDAVKNSISNIALTVQGERQCYPHSHIMHINCYLNH